MKTVNVYFSSKKLDWQSEFSAPDNWDELSSSEQFDLIEEWKQNEIDRFVSVDIVVE